MRRILHLIESSYQGRLYLYRQELRESYASGKDIMTVSRGFFEWREDINPLNGDSTYTFTACNGTTTMISPDYGGTLSLIGTRTIKRWCPL